ncbi:hypothetical protein FRUB_05612 [Fimbriiglobus ruber]|uniref:Uncharacterized protein n=1 Tax=Fimbriiglobus ruber TaxID=1908690 RepID=A0A225DE25_9BACT|nr:hypothetical protein FRUB_05612 [Fimbriiglobus ruber]
MPKTVWLIWFITYQWARSSQLPKTIGRSLDWCPCPLSNSVHRDHVRQ